MPEDTVQLSPYRRITPFEWAYLAAARHFPPFAVQLLIEFDSLPAVSSLEDALHSAASLNPGARLIARGRCWFDSGLAPAVRVVTPAQIFSPDHPWLHEGFSRDEHPPMEVLYWPGCGLVFRCSHALMDAAGLLFFAQECFRALRGEALRGTASKISDHEFLKRRKHPERRPALRPDRPSPLGPPHAHGNGFVHERRFIAGQVTATGARMASFLARQRPGQEIRIMLPVDLRRTDPSLRSTANLSNPLFLDLPFGSAWEDCYQHIIAALRRHDEYAMSSLDGFIPAMPQGILGKLFAWLHGRQARRDGYLYSATISHVGAVALRDLSATECPARAASFLPFDAPGSAITLDSIQHDHGLEISASSPAASGGRDRLASLLDMLCAELREGVPPACRSADRSPAALTSICGVEQALPALTVYALFVEQAGLHPRRIALSQGKRKISYAELLKLVTSCSARLQEQGVLPGDRVAIMADRRAEVVIAVLGVLRLGATFVPIDPEWPEARIRFVLEDCAPGCLVADDAGECPTRPRRLPMSSLLEATDSPSVQPVMTRESPAYLLYTSGSTGNPKGVLVGQRSLLNYVLWGRSTYLRDMPAPAIFPFFTSLAFDLTLTSIFIPLTSGGEVRVFPQRDVLLTIRAILDDADLTAVKLTPSHLRLFAELGIREGRLCTFIVGGEALQTQLATEVHRQTGARADIFNEYGPTEATVGCVVHRFDPARDRDAFVPIGRPIANTEVLLLDEHGRGVAPGQAGEIHLAGACLALGYLSRPTEERRFAPHPQHAGARAYRTGDRARQLADGTLDYLGRLDDQVKISGRRIEIGEVEAAIDASGLCVGCAVLAEDTPAGAKLAAFVVWRDRDAEAGAALRDALAASLPAWMLPSRILGLDAIPLNVNGKVDKARLLRDHTAPQSHQVVAEGETMEVLRAIVGELTGHSVADIPVGESLLDLGLDSLQMVMLLTQSARQLVPGIAQGALFADLETFVREPSLQCLARHLRALAVRHLRRVQDAPLA